MPLDDLPDLRRLLEAGIAKYDLADLRAAILAAAEPCLLLYGDDDGGEGEPGPVGGSRLGGRPDLPDAATWPEHEGELIPFLAQFDLAALPRFPGNPLPADGWLFLFACGDSDDIPATALHHRGDRAALAPRRVREGRIRPDGFGERRYDPVPIRAVRPAVSLTEDAVFEVLSVGREEGDFPDLPIDRRLRLAHLSASLNPSSAYDSRLGNIVGQLLGHPNFPGASPRDAVEYGGRSGDDWMQLLEIQSVGSMMWSDCGMLNLAIRRADLDRRDFTRMYASVASG